MATVNLVIWASEPPPPPSLTGKSKYLREKKKNFHFAYFENFLNGQSPISLKHILVTFYLPHIFQYIPLKNVVNYFCLKKIGLCFLLNGSN